MGAEEHIIYSKGKCTIFLLYLIYNEQNIFLF